MLLLQGTPASGGVAMGSARLLTQREPRVSAAPAAQSPGRELARLQAARTAAEREIEEIYKNACQNIGKHDSLIFHVHIMMLEDETFQQSMIDCIVKERATAEYAVWKAGRQMYEMFLRLDDEYMRARSEDMLDISHRLLACLSPSGPPVSPPQEANAAPAVLCMTQALPSLVMQMNHDCTLGFVTQYGSSMAHSAILARVLRKPAVLDLGSAFNELRPGVFLIVDGDTGQVIVDPTPTVRDQYAARLTGEKQTPVSGSGGTHT